MRVLILPKAVYFDQDVMNIACAGKVRRLPLNYIGYAYLRDYLDRPGLDSPYTWNDLYKRWALASVARPQDTLVRCGKYALVRDSGRHVLGPPIGRRRT